MENRINQVLVIDENLKYLILRQAIYNNENYYVCSKIDQENDSVTDEFELLHEINEDGKTFVEMVADEKLYKLLFEKLGLEK